MITAIREQVPAYARPLEGSFGVTVRLAVEQALSQFIAMARAPGLGRGAGREVYVRIGRGEARDGRSLEALLAAYRVGARVAWRRLAGIGLDAGLAPETLVRLAESIFAYIDELSAESAEGYAQEQAERAGESDRRKQLLIGLLLQVPAADPNALGVAAESARWPLPAALAVAVWPQEGGRRPAADLPPGTIVAQQESVWCALVPDPNGPGRRAQVRRALASTPAGVGPCVAGSAAQRSFLLAGQALALALEREAGSALFAEEHRLDLILRAERGLVAELASERLRPLEDETDLSRARLEATLLAWLRHDGDVTAAAAELIVHPQTVRYRLGRLRDVFGTELENSEARFELELVLRAAVTAGGDAAAPLPV